MYVDKQLLLSDSQDLSQTAATYSSTNIIDLTAVGREIGQGKPVGVVVVVDEAFASSGAATVVFSLVANDDEDLTTSATVLYATPAIGYASLTLGKVIVLPIPVGRIPTDAQYIGVTYTIGAATTTAGTCSAFLAFEW